MIQADITYDKLSQFRKTMFHKINWKCWRDVIVWLFLHDYIHCVREISWIVARRKKYLDMWRTMWNLKKQNTSEQLPRLINHHLILELSELRFLHFPCCILVCSKHCVTGLKLMIKRLLNFQLFGFLTRVWTLKLYQSNSAFRKKSSKKCTAQILFGYQKRR